MDFVKKHYEKILLSVVLLGLVGALVFLPVLIINDQDALRRMKDSIIRVPVVPLPTLDMSGESNIWARLQSPYKLDFSTTNKLFNPLPWQKKFDGTLVPVKIGLIGPEAAVVTKITPLCLVLTLDSIETNELGARYNISVERQAAAQPGKRIRQPHYASIGEKIDAFTIVNVVGSPEDPAQLKLVLQLTDTGEKVTVSKDKPFRRTDGYSADLKYEPEGRKWQGQRIGAVLKFAGDDNIIVAIDEGTVVLLARSNQKKTTLTYSPNP
jgi:hypothetical protein